ncbi:MAG TPA: twin-arginine translocation signal domain-containing protein, partial [Candidatus Acidoferrum sp.]|nr:twin-arginine translocation signal domain-containing protein [Candidatus Acidoferrum sp.]
MAKPGKHGSMQRRTFLRTAAAAAVGVALPGALPSWAPAQARKQTVTIWSHFAGKNYEILTQLVS